VGILDLGHAPVPYHLMVSKKTMEINPKHSIMDELKKKATADKSDKTVKDLIRWIFDISLLTSGLNVDEPTQFAGRIHLNKMNTAEQRELGLV
jgi:HSP90 family molecular chaperone